MGKNSQNWIFCQKLNFLSKTEFFVKNWIFCQKLNYLSKFWNVLAKFFLKRSCKVFFETFCWNVFLKSFFGKCFQKFFGKFFQKFFWKVFWKVFAKFFEKFFESFLKSFLEKFFGKFFFVDCIYLCFKNFHILKTNCISSVVILYVMSDAHKFFFEKFRYLTESRRSKNKKALSGAQQYIRPKKCGKKLRAKKKTFCSAINLRNNVRSKSAFLASKNRIKNVWKEIF